MATTLQTYNWKGNYVPLQSHNIQYVMVEECLSSLQITETILVWL